eukprot:5132163-Pleurochrysis_carterae.AAC.2
MQLRKATRRSRRNRNLSFPLRLALRSRAEDALIACMLCAQAVFCRALRGMRLVRRARAFAIEVRWLAPRRLETRQGGAAARKAAPRSAASASAPCPHTTTMSRWEGGKGQARATGHGRTRAVTAYRWLLKQAEDSNEARTGSRADLPVGSKLAPVALLKVGRDQTF